MCVKLTIPLSSAEVKNEWNRISAPQYVEMILLITLNDIFFLYNIIYNSLLEIVYTSQTAS